VLVEQGRREGDDREFQPKREVDPGEATTGTLQVIELRLLAYPENPQRHEAHEVHNEARRKRNQRALAIRLAVNQLGCGAPASTRSMPPAGESLGQHRPG